MRFLTVLLLLVFSTILLSKNKLDSLVAVGNEQSFQFNFLEANRTFEEVIKLYPNSALGYYFISRNNLWFYLANKDSVSKKQFLDYVEKAFSKAENEYEEHSDSAVFNYYLGNVYLLKSIYSSTEQNSMDAFWATKKAVNYFEEAIDIDSTFYDSYLSLGTVKYALGFVPGFLGWAISVAGLDGEKSEGLALILKAYENSAFSRIEASYHLGKIYTEFNAEYDSAEFHLGKLVEKYPQNELFLYQYAILQIDKRNLVGAEKYLDRITSDKYKHIFSQTYALSLFLKGEISFKRNEFSKAIKGYQKFISNTNSIDYTGIAYFKIALSYLMLNDELNEQKYLLLARNGNLNIAEDSFANDMSQVLFDKKYNYIDKLIMLAQNNLEDGKYKLVEKKISEARLDSATNQQKFKLDIISVEAFQMQRKYSSSKIILDKYVELDSFNKNEDFAKLLYFKSKQAFSEMKYQLSAEILDLAFENINDNNNKLYRLLVNLNSKINLKTMQ